MMKKGRFVWKSKTIYHENFEEDFDSLVENFMNSPEMLGAFNIQQEFKSFGIGDYDNHVVYCVMNITYKVWEDSDVL